MPGASLPWIDGAPGVLLCIAALAAVAVVTARGRVPRALVTTAGLGLAVSVTAYAGALGGGLVARSVGMPGDWQIAVCDVGQGDALLLRDADAVGMIDVGRSPEAAARCMGLLTRTRRVSPAP